MRPNLMRCIWIYTGTRTWQDTKCGGVDIFLIQMMSSLLTQVVCTLPCTFSKKKKVKADFTPVQQETRPTQKEQAHQLKNIRGLLNPRRYVNYTLDVTPWFLGATSIYSRFQNSQERLQVSGSQQITHAWEPHLVPHVGIGRWHVHFEPKSGLSLREDSSFHHLKQ